MTIRNKGSRKIIVEHELYRWVIHPSASGVITLTVQHAEVKGRLLRVNIESDINELWMEFPHVDSLNIKIVVPAEIGLIISNAIRQGWNPKEKGPLLSFNLLRNKLVPLI